MTAMDEVSSSSDAAALLDEELPLDECSSFLVEEIEIEMQEEQLTQAPDSTAPDLKGLVVLDDEVEEVVCISSEEAVMDTDSPPLVDDFEPHSLEAPTPPESSMSVGPFVCKWTNCDWPGSYDDLVDHIREIHVELQPYHSLPDRVLAPVSSRRGSKCSSTVSSCSSYENPASVTSSVSSEETAPVGPATVRSQSASSSPPSSSSPPCFANPCDSFRPSSSASAQQQDKSYVCLWEGCKVYGIRSQKRSWLDRHVLQHSGDKPFKCIVDKCDYRFKTQAMLERHVNSHFTASKDPQNGTANSLSLNSDGCSEHGSDDLSRRTTMMRAKSSGSIGGTPVKVGKKKKPRVRKLLIRSSNEDFFDPAIMDVIQFRLFQQHQSVLHQQVSSSSKQQDVQPTRCPLPAAQSTLHTALHSTVRPFPYLPTLCFTFAPSLSSVSSMS